NLSPCAPPPFRRRVRAIEKSLPPIPRLPTDARSQDPPLKLGTERWLRLPRCARGRTNRFHSLSQREFGRHFPYPAAQVRWLLHREAGCPKYARARPRLAHSIADRDRRL